MRFPSRRYPVDCVATAVAETHPSRRAEALRFLLVESGKTSGETFDAEWAVARQRGRVVSVAGLGRAACDLAEARWKESRARHGWAWRPLAWVGPAFLAGNAGLAVALLAPGSFLAAMSSIVLPVALAAWLMLVNDRVYQCSIDHAFLGTARDLVKFSSPVPARPRDPGEADIRALQAMEASGHHALDGGCERGTCPRCLEARAAEARHSDMPDPRRDRWEVN